MLGIDIPRNHIVACSRGSGARKPQAIILAAGRGQRLGDYAEAIPKCLLQVGGRSLLDHQLDMLADVGIEDICIVAGYQRHSVERACNQRAQVIVNPDWATTNSLYSLSLAGNWVNRDVVVLNGDVLVDTRVLSRLMDQMSSCFAYDSSSGSEAEHMKVELLNGVLLSMSKDLDIARVQGENVGILYFAAREARQLFVHADTLIGSGGRSHWLARAVQELARESALAGVDIRDIPWIEIDYHEDLERARNHTWPLILQSTALPSGNTAKSSLPATCAYG